VIRFFHFNNHPTRIRLAHCLEHQRQQRFQAGHFLRQFLIIFCSGKILECSSISSFAIGAYAQY
jgi:hypothetical protein